MSTRRGFLKALGAGIAAAAALPVLVMLPKPKEVRYRMEHRASIIGPNWISKVPNRMVLDGVNDYPYYFRREGNVYHALRQLDLPNTVLEFRGSAKLHTNWTGSFRECDLRFVT